MNNGSGVNTILIVIVIIILVGGAVWWYKNNSSAPAPAQQGIQVNLGGSAQE